MQPMQVRSPTEIVVAERAAPIPEALLRAQAGPADPRPPAAARARTSGWPWARRVYRGF